jgi:hypothetical protein
VLTSFQRPKELKIIIKDSWDPYYGYDEKWSFNNFGYSYYDVDLLKGRDGKDAILAASETGYIYSLDPADGSLNWSRHLGSVVHTVSAYADKYITAGTEKGDVFVLDGDGKMLYKCNLGGKICKITPIGGGIFAVADTYANVAVVGWDQDALAPKGKVVFEDDFEDNMKNWWVEGSDKVTVKDGRMYINANDPDGSGSDIYCTIWCRDKIDGDNVHIKFDACVLDSKKGVNNINFFLNYSLPQGGDIYETRSERESGAYALYHDLNGYIFTYLRDIAGESEFVNGRPQGRVRIRKCPGFNMIAESYAYNAEAGEVREIEIIKKGGDIFYKVDGKILCQVHDDDSWDEGYFGLRTYMTSLWVDNFVVTELEE